MALADVPEATMHAKSGSVLICLSVRESEADRRRGKKTFLGQFDLAMRLTSDICI